MSRQYSLVATFVVAFSLLATACGGGGGGSAPPANPPTSSTATLDSLTLSAGAVAPAFQSATSDYMVSVPNATDSTTVTPVTTDANATVTVNGATVASGVGSTSIALVVGDTTIAVVVTAEDGSTTQTYTVTVTRAPPGNIATLSGLTVSAGAIAPTFQATTSDYTLTVPNATATTTVTPTTTDSNATVTVNGSAVVSGTASAPIAFDTITTEIAVAVTAEDGSTTQTYVVTVTRALSTFELRDPTPGASDLFGQDVVILGNGNIVVTDPFDSSVAANSGAVHVYNPLTQALIASIYGDQVDDNLGRGGVTALGNGNFVIVSPNDNNGAIADAGSVRLVNGSSGVQIGTALVGDQPFDQLGRDGVTVLSNNNYVVGSQFDDSGAIGNAGSVRLVDGITGLAIGAPLVGNLANDRVGSSGIVALGNANYVVASGLDDFGLTANVGSVRLVSGITGLTIGPAIFGDQPEDRLGSSSITVLSNNNYVIASSNDDNGATVSAGSVRLVDGASGAPIGTPLLGNQPGDNLGSGGITALGNNNYVVASFVDDDGATVDAGSVRLMNGTTGAQIGTAVVGDQTTDVLGSGGVTALGNNNYVIRSQFDDNGATVDAGSVRLVDGSTGVTIGAPLFGDQPSDRLGISGVVALPNNNYVIASDRDDDGPITEAGSVRLIDGTSGVQIGATLVGDQLNDRLGSGGITALPNNNFVIVSEFDNDGLIADAGSVWLVDGASGSPIGTPLVGDQNDDLLGDNGVVALSNSNYVVTSLLDDDGAAVDVGSVFLLNGATGAPIGSTTRGLTAVDFQNASITVPENGSYFVLGAPDFDNSAGADSGFVGLIAE